MVAICNINCPYIANILSVKLVFDGIGFEWSKFLGSKTVGKVGRRTIGNGNR